MKTATFRLLLGAAVGVWFGAGVALGACGGDSGVAGEWIFESEAEAPGWAINSGGDGDMGNLGLTGGAAFSTDVPPVNCDCGHSLELPGTNGAAGAVSVASYDPLAGAEKFAVMAWVRRESAEGENLSARIFSDADSTALTNTTAGVEFRFSGSAGNLALRINGTEVATSVGGIAPDNGEWHHVAAVYDGTRAATNYATRNVHFYVDGVQKGVGSVLQGVVVASNDAPVVVGNASAARTAGNLLAGNVDDVLVLPGWAPDAAGNGNANAAIQCFMDTADDIFPPSIAAPSDVEAEAGECLEPVAVALGSPAAWDDCGVASVANDAPAAFGVGETTVTWTATDVAGNTASDTQTVAVWPRGSADCDGDGWSDLEEWEAGTDPGDAASAPTLAKGVLIHAVRYNAAESNQYVQLYNAGRYPVQLDGFSLEVAGEAYETKLTFPTNTIMNPGHYLLIGGSGVERRDFTALLELPMSYANLPTAGVRLVGPPETTNSPVDVVMYGAHIPFNAQGLSMAGWLSTNTDLWAGPNYELIRIRLGFDTNARSDWRYSALPESLANASDVLDSDSDGLTDEEECRGGTSPSLPDTDGDRLEDDFELAHGLDPTLPDSDDDGVPDDEERDPETGKFFCDEQLGNGMMVDIVSSKEGWHLGNSIGRDGTVDFTLTEIDGVGIWMKLSEGGFVSEDFGWSVQNAIVAFETNEYNATHFRTLFALLAPPTTNGFASPVVIHVYDDSSDSGVTNPPDLGPDMAVRFTSIKLDICLEGMDEESEEVPGVAIPDGSVHTNAPRSMLTLESTRILGLPGMLILNWDSSAIKLYATPEGEDEVTSYAVPWSHFPGAVFFAEGFAPTHAAMRCFASLAPTCHDWLQAVVLQVGITFADPDDPTWSELAERKVILSDDETRLKISICPQQDSFENVLALLGADVVLSSSATAPAGIVLEMNADNTCFYQESVGSVLKIALTQDQLRNMGLLPEQAQDLLQEKAWYDTGFDVTVNSPNLLDGREFDRMVPFESRGQCTRAIYGGLEATPPNSPLDRTFFQAAGREILAASYWWSASPLRQLMNQADVFYYSGHGYHSPGNLEAGSANDVSPYWTNDLDIAIFAGCSVLDINDCNNNFTNQTDHLLSPGKTWASVGPDVMLGYNYTAPTDMQGSDMIILNWASNHSNGEDAITAWKNANDNSHGRNACAIQEGAGYYYFHKTPGLLFNTYTRTFIPESEW